MLIIIIGEILFDEGLIDEGPIDDGQTYEFLTARLVPRTCRAPSGWRTLLGGPLSAEERL